MSFASCPAVRFFNRSKRNGSSSHSSVAPLALPIIDSLLATRALFLISRNRLASLVEVASTPTTLAATEFPLVASYHFDVKSSDELTSDASSPPPRRRYLSRSLRRWNAPLSSLSLRSCFSHVPPSIASMSSDEYRAERSSMTKS